jgi:fructuronate reductase
LAAATAGALAPQVARPAYDRAAQDCGIVHLGIGAFHRAHQAVYTDDAMAAGDRGWGITGVSLRSPEVRAQMQPQDCLYTLTERSPAHSSTRLIGAIRQVIAARESPQAVIAALASAHTRIVTLTVTEKAYFRQPDGGLDIEAPDVAHDLAGPQFPRTIYGYLALAFARRRADRLPGFTLLSCDNLADNGRRLAALQEAFIERADPTSLGWFRSECACPSTMVDRIVPAATDDDRRAVAAAIGLRDEAAAVTEPFRQWVIEDRFAGPHPRWEAGGAQWVADVRPYETAKLRMLNGAHSALAYLGLRRGHAFVHQAIADPPVRAIVEALMREAAQTLDPAAGLDPAGYGETLLRRFANSALPHLLAQIAMDGSQKIPQRWLPALAIRRAEGRQSPALLHALAAWVLHVRGDRGAVDDPVAPRLAALWRESGAEGIAAALFGTGGMFAPAWTASPGELTQLAHAIAAPI